MSYHPPQQRSMSPVPRQAAPHPSAQRPRPQTIVVRDSAAITRLRVTTYVLCSLAAVVFLVVVVYGYLQLRQAAAAFEQLGSLPTPTFEQPAVPGPVIGG